ncbi:hypothetical protein PL11_008295 [Lentilactobacillus curieae]|uniref:DUF2798 domain-containing protein n=2 Tax=Lentilactobacillus curieae TaxID=1138822 RepID=A0A1S6QL74_9LACO|nr:hypothetical protein PL11_008295 [Lentilactobacillus curieae]
MDFYMKLPRNRKEFSLFIFIVSVLSVNIIAPLISCFEMGFSFETWKQTLGILPFMWVVVVLLVLLTNSLASKVTGILISEEDSFSAHMIINTLVNVMMMSIVLSVVGVWIGTKTISWFPIEHFFYKWPRNFTISFLVEACIAQPFARLIILKKHQVQDRQLNVH